MKTALDKCHVSLSSYAFSAFKYPAAIVPDADKTKKAENTLELKQLKRKKLKIIAKSNKVYFA